MNKRNLFVLLSLIAALAMVISACAPAAEEAPAATEEAMTEEAPAATEEPVATEEAMPAVGSPEHPIKVLFVPSVDANIIVTGGEVMAQALNEATGLTFEVVVPTSYAATIEEMCVPPPTPWHSSPVSVTPSPASSAVWMFPSKPFALDTLFTGLNTS